MLYTDCQFSYLDKPSSCHCVTIDVIDKTHARKQADVASNSLFDQAVTLTFRDDSSPPALGQSTEIMLAAISASLTVAGTLSRAAATARQLSIRCGIIVAGMVTVLPTTGSCPMSHATANFVDKLLLVHALK